MQISCPKCSACYELDDRLIPASGAPVQCSHCTQVFIAKREPDTDPYLKAMNESSFEAGAASRPVPASSVPPVPRAATQIFGAPPLNPSKGGASESVSVNESPPRSGTIVFGATAAASAPALGKGTQLFGRPATAAPPPERISVSSSPGPGTVFFGKSAPEAEAQMLKKTTVPQFPGVSVSTSEADSQIFTKPLHSSEPEVSEPMRAELPGIAASPGEPEWASGAALKPAQEKPNVRPGVETPILRKPPVWPPPQPKPAEGQAPSSLDPLVGAPAATRAPKTGPGPETLFFGRSGALGGQLGRPSRVELPPMELSIPQPATEIPDEAELLLQSQIRRRNRLTLFGVLTIVAALVVFGVSKALRKNGSGIPTEAANAHADAVVRLRQDDSASKLKVSQQLEELVRRYPSFVQARSTQLIALALQLDDLKLEINHLDSKSQELNNKIRETEQRKASSDWQNRVNALVDQLNSLRREKAPLVEQANAVDAKTNEAFSSLTFKTEALQPGDELAIIRAQAVYLGVKGSDRVRELAEKYRSLGGKDGWDAIAVGEYTVNAKVPNDEMIGARLALDRLRSLDPALVRAYLLGARQAMSLNQFDAAASLLEAAAALNPSHEMARKLITWLQESPSGAVNRPP